MLKDSNRQALIAIEGGEWSLRLTEGTTEDIFGVELKEHRIYGAWTSYDQLAHDAQRWIEHGKRPTH